MQQTVKAGENKVVRATYLGRPVMWAAQIAACHGVPEKTIMNLYTHMKLKFDAVRSFTITGSQIEELDVPIHCRTKKMRLFTEDGYRILAKALIARDPKHQAVFDDLIEFYFNDFVPTEDSLADDDEILSIASRIVKQQKDIQELRSANTKLQVENAALKMRLQRIQDWLNGALV